jgi:Kyanoviridae head maturation protease
MKLIAEQVEDLRVITEEHEGKKRLHIEGVVLQAGIANRNKRIYPPPVLEREVAKYIGSAIDGKCAWGELGHPSGPTINLDRVSHRITELRKSGNDYIGRAIVCDTPYGKIVEGLIASGGNIGASSRGMGSLKPDSSGINVVQDDYRLMVGFDVVADPSAPNAWVNGIMENVDWRLNEAGEWVQGEIEQAKKTIKKMSTRQLQEQKIGLFNGFMERLHQKEFGGLVATMARQAGVTMNRANQLMVEAKRRAHLYGGTENDALNELAELLSLGTPFDK